MTNLYAYDASPASALLVVDMVNDFTQPTGLVYYPQNEEILPHIVDLIDLYHHTQRPVIFLTHVRRADKPDHKAAAMRPNCIEGTWGAQLDDRLPVLSCDYIVPKRRYSGFFGTDLDLILRELGITNVVVVGTKTNCCIRATVTDAFYLNYTPYVVRECVGTNSDIVQQVHLDDIDKYLGHVIDLATCRAYIDKEVL